MVLHIVVIQSISDILYTPCSTNGTLINYNINSNDIANFFTLYYPKNLIDNGTAISCQARFFTIVENHKIWMALYNGYTGDFIAFDDELNQFGQSFDSTNGIASFSSKTQSLTFKLNTLESNDWVAFEAVVIAYDPEIVQCPFSGQNISFFDSEKLIIPIASDFGQKTSDTNCQWTFRPSYRTYLKIVIQSLILNENIIFELKQNGTTIKRFDKNISKPEVYYFSADLGDLILYYSDTNDAISGNGFSALISEAIVPSSSLTEECPSMMKDNVLTVSNLDYEIGYKANQKCEYSIEVKENQEVFVEVTVFHIEKNVDKLSVIFEEFNYPLDEEDFNNILQVTSSANNSLISFEADSNIQQAGFESTPGENMK
uniref:CUB domain-containing protein n=1 Tax=Panagrolaimus sp. PS1159 TaxID=55785 RepID=A0AC35FXW3_9BILA